MNNEYVKEYILNNYGINFELITEMPSDYEKYQSLKHKKGKVEYELHCDYAYHYDKYLNDRVHTWSIYYNYMDYKNWHGAGGTYEDEGDTTIDKIMQDWGFEKKSQTNIFDYIGVD